MLNLLKLKQYHFDCFKTVKGLLLTGIILGA